MDNSSYFRFDDDDQTKGILSQSSQGKLVNWKYVITTGTSCLLKWSSTLRAKWSPKGTVIGRFRTKESPTYFSKKMMFRYSYHFSTSSKLRYMNAMSVQIMLNRLFVQYYVHISNKRNIKAHYWPCVKGMYRYDGFPSQCPVMRKKGPFHEVIMFL